MIGKPRCHTKLMKQRGAHVSVACVQATHPGIEAAAHDCKGRLHAQHAGQERQGDVLQKRNRRGSRGVGAADEHHLTGPRGWARGRQQHQRNSHLGGENGGVQWMLSEAVPHECILFLHRHTERGTHLRNEGAAAGSASIACILPSNAVGRLHCNGYAADPCTAHACAAHVLQQLERGYVLASESGCRVGGADIGQKHASAGETCQGHGHTHHLATSLERGTIDQDPSWWHGNRDGAREFFDGLGALRGCNCPNDICRAH